MSLVCHNICFACFMTTLILLNHQIQNIRIRLVHHLYWAYFCEAQLNSGDYSMQCALNTEKLCNFAAQKRKGTIIVSFVLQTTKYTVGQFTKLD